MFDIYFEIGLGNFVDGMKSTLVILIIAIFYDMAVHVLCIIL